MIRGVIIYLVFKTEIHYYKDAHGNDLFKSIFDVTDLLSRHLSTLYFYPVVVGDLGETGIKKTTLVCTAFCLVSFFSSLAFATAAQS